MNKITLVPYSPQLEKETVSLIRAFWLAHNGYDMPEDGAREDLAAWTADGHVLYLVKNGDAVIGFAHLGSRGCAIDWLEDLFILPEFQGRGYGSRVVHLLETIVQEYSESLYIEVAARNQRAARLYRRLGYDVLNTITVRKDFEPEKHETVSNETVSGCDYVIRRRKE